MPAFKAVFLGSHAALDRAGLLLTEVLYPPAGAVSLTKDDDAREDAAWRLEAYFMERPRIDALMALLAETGLGPPAVEELPDIDWV
ncbi:MAG: hypothetical protein HXY21_05080, partial [Parvularculaceae bacterium]|nr:hypothetical protein [Parvularculaceae bacterium]